MVPSWLLNTLNVFEVGTVDTLRISPLILIKSPRLIPLELSTFIVVDEVVNSVVSRTVSPE